MTPKPDNLEDYDVPADQRLDTDEGPDSDALGDGTGDDADDLDRYKPGGDLYTDKVIPEDDLA